MIRKCKKELKATNTQNVQWDQKKFGFSVTLFYPQQKKILSLIIFLYDQCQHHAETRESRFTSLGKSF